MKSTNFQRSKQFITPGNISYPIAYFKHALGWHNAMWLFFGAVLFSVNVWLNFTDSSDYYKTSALILAGMYVSMSLLLIVELDLLDTFSNLLGRNFNTNTRWTKVCSPARALLMTIGGNEVFPYTFKGPDIIRHHLAKDNPSRLIESTPAGFNIRNAPEFMTDIDVAFSIVMREALTSWISSYAIPKNTSLTLRMPSAFAQRYIVEFFPEIVWNYPTVFDEYALESVKNGLYQVVKTLQDSGCTFNEIVNYVNDWRHSTVNTGSFSNMSLPENLMSLASNR